VIIRGFDAFDRDCPRRKCWAPGVFHHRGVSMSGSRNTGAQTKCCLHRANHGCPQPIHEPGAAKPQRRHTTTTTGANQQ
jgi:hypothetical protein